MTITLELTPEIETRLKTQAAQQGKDVQTFALEVLAETLRGEDTRAATMLPAAAWHERFNALLKALPKSEVAFVDDSRESIYDGRGE